MTRATEPRLPRRLFRDHVELSAIGFGGLLLTPLSQEQTDELVDWAMERGVNYFDVGPTYPTRQIGLCETKLGAAWRGRRDNVFLACKTTARDAAGAAREFDESRCRLQTDRFDLYQFHGVTTDDEVRQILAPGGAAEVFLREKSRGGCRYIGASVHSEDAALALLAALPLDAIMFGVNRPCLEGNGFGRRIFAAARERGAARLAIKALARRPHQPGEPWKYPCCWYLPYDRPAEVRAALRYAQAQDVTSVIAPADAGLFRLCVELGGEPDVAGGQPSPAAATPFAGTPIFPLDRK